LSNLIDIQSQIAKLQKQASEIRAKEFDSTVQEIIAKMQAYGITVKDLQSPKAAKAGRNRAAAKPASARPAKKAAPAVAPKYRGPNGETWSGRGLMPKWMATLVAAGQSRESFLIAS
jgi:DNA-binding protein H-NS